MIHNNTDVIDWLSFLFNKHSTDTVNLILIAIWAFWMSQNKGYHEGVVQTASSLVSLIYSYYKEVQVLGEVCSPSVGHHKRKWYSPTEPYVKVNFDAAYRVSILTVLFSNFIVKHCYGEENIVSHLLVAVGFNLGMDHFWVEDIPVEVEVIVAVDIWWVDLLD
ncbi:hypothetical protein PVK06_034010 [Gossypium arboreum]|uniref:Uncharacterized protein n=1 Tax=Gossypium arboreum TaxID=29729 RepID=A0ABR0NCY9_GOSAR|nr:hypothetical protein PVK06_034010 [Gossypium arboreum]